MNFNEVLNIIQQGGILFEFDNPLEYGLDDSEQNTLTIYNHQAKKLIQDKYVTLESHPAVGVTRYVWAGKK